MSSKGRLPIAGMLFLLLFLVACSSPGNNITQPDDVNLRGSLLGMASQLNMTDPDREMWTGSVEIDGRNWMADITPDGNVRWAAGGGIAVDDPLEFIDTHPELFRIGSESLYEICDEVHGDVRYAIYYQAVNGIPLIDSRIDLRIKYGNVILIGVKVDENLTNLPSVSVSKDYASRIARGWYPGNRLESCKLFAREYDSGYLPFYRVYIGNYYMEISAVDGAILVDDSALFDFDYEGEVSGYISEVNPLLDRPIEGFNDLNVFFYEESTLASTDINGNYYSSSDTYGEQLTLVTPKGDWAEIQRYDQATAAIEVTTYRSSFAEFTFDDDNSAHSERNVFYFTNAGHNYIKNIEPGFTAVDFPVVSSVMRNAWCNAQASMNKMYFYKQKGNCLNLGDIPDVVLHEYGHVFVFQHYWSIGEAEAPGSLHEGFADYFAATVTNQPLIGYNWKGSGTRIRNCDNNKMWPGNNCGGQSHCLGNIIAGALWDLRKVLGREMTDRLWHYSKYGIPQTFPEQAMEMCVADDDDGDLSNGTPHFTEIYLAYDQEHGIPMPSAPNYIDITLSVVTDDANPTISNATGGSIGYTIHVDNIIGQIATVDAWAAVLRPNGMWHGPMVPPTHYLGIPPILNFSPYMNFQYHLVQNIPPGLPIGAVYQYYVRLGDYVDMTNDVIDAEDVFSFEIVP